MNFLNGEIVYIDKGYRLTSFKAVAKVRYLISKKIGVKKLKVGHAGTLDPLATGVLIICTGKATKKIDQLQAHTKEYVAGLKLGATTPSFDMEHPEDQTYPVEHITKELVEETLQKFVGEIQQVPPTYSACMIDGHRAYELARKGKDVELKPKVLVIDEIELVDFNPEQMQATLRIVCSKGTYIRALARDIGQALHSGAHLIALRRTRVGDIRVEQCMQVDDFPAWLDTQSLSPLTPQDGENETTKISK